MERKEIVIFTNTYPYGMGFNWLDSEIELFSGHFDRVTILPFNSEGNTAMKQLQDFDNLHIEKPLFQQDVKSTIHVDWLYLFSPRFIFYISEFFREKIYSSSYWIKSWFKAIKLTERFFKSKRFVELFKKSRNTILYFYWGNNQALMVPFLRKAGFKEILVRFHGFDLYKERLGGYQPFRRPLLRSLKMAAPISLYGKHYLKEEYHDIQFECIVSRLGVKEKGLSSPSEDGTIRIVSCATVIPLKRIELIPKVLARVNQRIHWIHIGDGPYEWKVKEAIESLESDHLSYHLIGRIPADQVQEYYRQNQIDIFVSLSSTEGIPVSMMEALSSGIPVFSTDVGGISELIDDECGRLISKDVNEDQIAMELESFIGAYLKTTKKIREASYNRFLKMCNLDRINNEFLKTTTSLDK